MLVAGFGTEEAFKSLSDRDLLYRALLFSLIRFNLPVRLLRRIIDDPIYGRYCVRLLAPLFRKLVFPIFCGGESIEEAARKLRWLRSMGMEAMVDYGVEHAVDREWAMINVVRWKEFMKEAKKFGIRLIAIKLSGIIPEKVLIEQSANVDEGLVIRRRVGEWGYYSKLVDELIDFGVSLGFTILVDAEESWIQPAIDVKCLEWMRVYNRTNACIYCTLQMYLKRSAGLLEKLIKISRAEGFILAVKLVRGAYVEKEWEYARRAGNEYPLLAGKANVDSAYNAAVMRCIGQDNVYLCVATHNVASTVLAREIAERSGVKGSGKVWFAHLLGMADPLSVGLVKDGFMVAKFMPVGSAEQLVPYLVRRLEENSGIHQQFARELMWYLLELRRREGTLR